MLSRDAWEWSLRGDVCVSDPLIDPQMKTHRRPLLDLQCNNSWIRNVKDVRLWGKTEPSLHADVPLSGSQIKQIKTADIFKSFLDSLNWFRGWISEVNCSRFVPGGRFSLPESASTWRTSSCRGTKIPQAARRVWNCKHGWLLQLNTGCVWIQGLHPSEEHLKANYVTTSREGCPNLKAPPNAPPFPSSWRMHGYDPSWPHISQDSLRDLT